MIIAIQNPNPPNDEYTYEETLKLINSIDKNKLLNEMEHKEIQTIYSDKNHKIEIMKYDNKILTFFKNYSNEKLSDIIIESLKVKFNK